MDAKDLANDCNEISTDDVEFKTDEQEIEICHQRSSKQSFMKESLSIRGCNNEAMTDQITKNHQQISCPNDHKRINYFATKRSRVITPLEPSKIPTTRRNKNFAMPEEPEETSMNPSSTLSETGRSSLSFHYFHNCRYNRTEQQGNNKICDHIKPTWKPAGSFKDVSSTSVASSASGQSRMSEPMANKSTPKHSSVIFSRVKNRTEMNPTERVRVKTPRYLEFSKVESHRAHSRDFTSPQTGKQNFPRNTLKRTCVLRSDTVPVHRTKNTNDLLSKNGPGGRVVGTWKNDCSSRWRSRVDEPWKRLSSSKSTMWTAVPRTTVQSWRQKFEDDGHLGDSSCNERSSTTIERIIDSGQHTSALLQEDEIMARHKFHEKHTRSLQMLKSILLPHQCVHIDTGLKKDTKTEQKLSTSIQIEKKMPTMSRTLLNDLAVLEECPILSPYPRNGDERCSLSEQSSLSDNVSETMRSCAKSMRDAEEQCSIKNTSSDGFVSQTSIESHDELVDRKTRATKHDLSMETTNQESICVKTISVNALTSPTTSIIKIVVETQTIDDPECRRLLLIDASTETGIATVDLSDKICGKATKSVDQSTIHHNSGPESKDEALRNDFSNIQRIMSRNFDTQVTISPFIKSHGVYFRGPQKIDATTDMTVKPFENSKEHASGNDYVDSSEYGTVSRQYVNTDRQDYLYVDRSVNVILPKMVDYSCQIEIRPKIVDAAVNNCVIVMDAKIGTVDVQAIDYFESSNSTTNYHSNERRCEPEFVSVRELIRFTDIAVPREVIVALEIAKERAKNLHKAIRIYRENLAITNRTTTTRTKLYLSKMKHQFSDHSETKLVRTKSNLKSRRHCVITAVKTKSSLNGSRSSATIRFDDYTESCGFEGEIIMKNCDEQKDQPCDSRGLENDCVEFAEFLYHLESTEEIFREIGDTIAQKQSLIRKFSLLSRNSLLTMVYGTVCSLVFWALQFSITCDSL